MTDLAPCPFCGSTDLTTATEYNRWRVYRYHCHASGPESKNYSEADAIAAWNKRAPPAAPYGTDPTWPGQGGGND